MGRVRLNEPLNSISQDESETIWNYIPNEHD